MNTQTATQNQTAATALDEALNTTDYRVALRIIASGVLGDFELDYLMDNYYDEAVVDAARDALIEMGAYWDLAAA